MTKTEHTVTIERPVQDIWAYLMDSRNDAVWITNVVEVCRGGDLPPAPGVEIEETLKFLGVKVPVTLTVTEHEPPVRSAVDVVGPVQGRGSYRLEPFDGGTRVTMTMETDAHGFFKLAEPVFARMARRDLATSCEHLKHILEANGTRRNDSRTDGP
jgi:Polyketide cyclase / dehydrase and lipid transport